MQRAVRVARVVLALLAVLAARQGRPAMSRLVAQAVLRAQPRVARAVRALMEALVVPVAMVVSEAQARRPVVAAVALTQLDRIQQVARVPSAKSALPTYSLPG